MGYSGHLENHEHSKYIGCFKTPHPVINFRAGRRPLTLPGSETKHLMDVAEFGINNGDRAEVCPHKFPLPPAAALSSLIWSCETVKVVKCPDIARWSSGKRIILQ